MAKKRNKKGKRPSFQFYPGDWLRDMALRSCSVEARGLWMDMICFMVEGNPFGYLKVGNKVILPSNLAVMVGLTLEVTLRLLQELQDAEVFSKNEAGCIYSRRMVRDEEVRAKRAAGGLLGGNPALKKDEIKVNLKGYHEGLQEDNHTYEDEEEDKEEDEIKKKDKGVKGKKGKDANTKFEIPSDHLLITSDEWKELWASWLSYKREEFKDVYKTSRSAIIAFDNLHEMSGGDLKMATEIVKQSVINHWKGLFHIKTNGSTTTQQRSKSDPLAGFKSSVANAKQAYELVASQPIRTGPIDPRSVDAEIYGTPLF
jgi:hypothetical protein